MEIVNVDLSKINLSDKSYYIPFNVISSDLITSIKKIGVINPPLLLSKSGSFIVISGWKRICIIKEQNQNYILSKVYQESELSIDYIIKIMYEDNKQRYSDVEIGLLASIYLQYKDTISSFLELIGLQPNEKNLDKYNCLSKVDNNIIDLYLDEKLNAEQVFILSKLRITDALIIANRVVIPYRFNANETREFVREIIDISNRDDKDIDDILDNLLNLNDQVSKDKIRYSLKKIRYPYLAIVEEQYTEYLRKLKLPKYINISHSPYFESNFIELIMRLDNQTKLKEVREFFTLDKKYSILSDLIKLVREGKMGL